MRDILSIDSSMRLASPSSPSPAPSEISKNSIPATDPDSRDTSSFSASSSACRKARSAGVIDAPAQETHISRMARSEASMPRSAASADMEALITLAREKDTHGFPAKSPPAALE
jgi:hypothetical protein